MSFNCQNKFIILTIIDKNMKVCLKSNKKQLRHSTNRLGLKKSKKIKRKIDRKRQRTKDIEGERKNDRFVKNGGGRV